MPKVYSAENVDGIEVKSDAQDVGGRIFADRARQILLSEHLVVLCGLGVSLCITTEDHRVAPTMRDLWSEAETLAGDKFDTLKQTVHYKKPDDQGDDVELLLSQCQLAQQFESSELVASFITDMEKRIVARCGFVTDETALPYHELFFRKVARRSVRMPRLQLFTTNYDLTFEKAAGRGGFILVDGFSHTQPQEFDGGYFAYDIVKRDRDGVSPEYIPNVLHLYKLHGSLDWERRGAGVFRAERPDRPLIIYPRDSKYQSSYDQPYLELMSRFHMALREQNTSLLVIGFGFNDQHIAEPVLSAIRSNVGLRVLVVDPAAMAMKNRGHQLRAFVAAGDARITLLDAKFEEFVTLLPDVVTTSEQEIHDRRVREIVSKS